MTKHILVIKLSALGDFVQAFEPFAAIRAHHADAEITLLTTRPYAEMAAASPWFDHIIIDERPKFWHFRKAAALKAQLRQKPFSMVYDLQCNQRTGWYFKMMGKPQWSGMAKGASHPIRHPAPKSVHTIDRQRMQLEHAGIIHLPEVDLRWTEGDIGKFSLSGRFVLLCPGAAPSRPRKRWAAENFAQVAGFLAKRDITPVIIGGPAEADAATIIKAACPRAVSLISQTSFVDIIGLARRAVGAIGNDTGPMHLIAMGYAPSLVLFGNDSDPNLCAPRGRVAILNVDNLSDLEVAQVEQSFADLLASPPPLRI